MSNANLQSKSAYSQKFLDEIKEILIKNKEKLENELAQFATKSDKVADDFDSRFPDFGSKDDENAAEVAEYAANLSIEQNLEKVLRDVTKSLKKIESGEYGVCQYCGNPIDEKRLRARPVSGSCVDCKKTIKQEV